MSTVDKSDNIRESVDLDVEAAMRRWGVNEVAARGMIALEKAGIHWAPAVVDEDDYLPPAA
jgi:hypothetical protein